MSDSASGGGAWWTRPASRWGLVALIAVLAVAVALWPRDGGDAEVAGPAAPRTPAAVSDAQRAAAGLAPCPSPAPGVTGTGPLAGLRLGCLADGAPVDLAVALAGRPAVVNLWAYWCGPCATELPHLQEFAGRAGPALTVLTVHTDPDEAKGLARLAGLGVTLPGVSDPQAKVRTAVGAPAVLPVTVLVRADGSIASVAVRAFSGVDDIADTVSRELGVRVAV